MTLRGRVLDTIRATAPVSRVEVAAATGLAQASVTAAVKELLAAGYVKETGRGASTGGRPRTLLSLNPGGAYALGAQLGWHRSTTVLADLTGAVVASADGEGAGSRPPEEIVAGLAKDVRRLRRRAHGPVLGLGLAVPGPIDAPHGTAVQLPSAAPWADFSLTGALGAATGLPVFLDNDATAAAVGEHWAGAAPGGVLALVYMERGIGAGIVDSGVPFRGGSGNAGEIGHISVDLTGDECTCGSRGCVELFAAPAATERRYREATGRSATHAEITTAAAEGDPPAVAVVDAAAAALAAAVVSFANVVDPDQIVIAGPGFAHATDRYVDAIQRRLDATAFVRRTHPVVVRAASESHLTAPLGAAALVLHDLVM